MIEMIVTHFRFQKAKFSPGNKLKKGEEGRGRGTIVGNVALQSEPLWSWLVRGHCHYVSKPK